MPTQLRLSMTLSGGASLGAYQAGAMAAVLVAVQHLLEHDEDRVRVEAMGGASAGALVAFFSAYALTEGLDPVRLLHTAWVEKVSLDLLRSRHARAPLDFEDMRAGLGEVLGAGEHTPDLEPRAPRHPTPVALHVSLTGLQGLTYPIRALRRGQEIPAVTYADWGQFVLEPGGGPDPLFEPEGASPLDFVLASAANPGGFAPRLLDRRGDAAEYRRRGVDGVPDHGRLWYSDGGLVQSEPVGRVLAAGRDPERRAPDRGGDVQRVALVVDPRSEGPSGSRRWADPDRIPEWSEGISRALAILPAQVIYDDIRRTEKRNARLEWAEALVDALASHLGEDAEEALDAVLRDMDADRAGLHGTAPDDADDPADAHDAAPGRDGVREKLGAAVAAVGGLEGKEPVAVDVISPLLLAEETGEEVPAMLAGEFLGDFGGFLREELRHSDFVLGYESALAWMRRALEEAGFEGDLRAAVVEEVERRRLGDWREANRGRAELRDLPWRARFRLGRYALHMLRVIGAGIARR